MATVAVLVDQPHIKELAAAKDFETGHNLAKHGSVELIEVTPLKVKAEVKDGLDQQFYEVKLVSALGRLIYSCTCAGNGFCQHCVAAAIALNQHPSS